MTRALASLVLLAATSLPPASAQSPSGSGLFRVTAYCQTGVTRSGEWTRFGVVAVDPKVVPLYSQVDIEGTSRTFTALDTGGGVLGQHLDIYMPECGDAIEWGVRFREVSWSAP